MVQSRNGMVEDAGGRAWRLPPILRIEWLEAGLKAYLPAKDSAALAAKAFDFLGMDSITFISCQS